MTRNSRFVPTVLLTGLVAAGCPTELETTDPIDLNTVVVAQFDPVHPIPVLRSLPSPTGLAQVPGQLGLTVRPQPCQEGTTTQCLQFASGWPLTVPATLFFSGALDETTVKDGVRLIARNGASLAAVDYSFAIRPRTPPPESCAAGGNGARPADPDLTELGGTPLACMGAESIGFFPTQYTESQIPTGIELILVPTEGFQPATDYVLLVESWDEDDGTAKGLRAADGSKVEASRTFALLNAEASPISSTGTVANPLLRSSLQNSVIMNYCGATTVGGNVVPAVAFGDLSASDKSRVTEVAEARAAAGIPALHGFFNQVIAPLELTSMTTRSRLAFVNAWSTDGGEFEFDPLAGRMPYPNVPLLTSPTENAATLNDVQMNLTIALCAEGETPEADGCDTPSSAALKTGLNTLDGFSTTAPITITATRDIDPDSLEGNVVMYPLNDQGVIAGDAIALEIRALPGTEFAPATLELTPATPLAESTSYVIGIKRGVRRVSTGSAPGPAFFGNATFDLLKISEPLLDMTGTRLNPELDDKIGEGTLKRLRQVLECSTVSSSTTGAIATEAQLLTAAGATEVLLQRARWQVAFEALEGATPEIERDDLLMAFTIKTQSITAALTAVEAQLMDIWSARADAGVEAAAQVLGPFQTIAGTAGFAEALNAVEAFCEPLCESLAGSPAACTDPIETSVVCLAAQNTLFGAMGSAQLYSVRVPRLTAGNPATAGFFNPALFDPANTPPFEYIPVWVVYPVGTSTDTPAAVTIFQHGLGGKKEDGLAIANEIAKSGHATFLMDLPFHGARASDIGTNTSSSPFTSTAPCADLANAGADPATIVCDIAGVCTGGCDGHQDQSGFGFLGTNLFATRDNLRQAAVDHLAIFQAIQAESGVGGRLARLDGTDIGYIGMSLGGITGGNFAAYQSDLSATVLNVAGGGLATNIILNSVPSITQPIFAGLAATGVCDPVNAEDLSEGCNPTFDFQRFVQTAQWILDPGDPLANSIALGEDDAVLLQMATPDGVVANVSTEALASAYGFSGEDSNFQIYDFTELMPVPEALGGCHGFLLNSSCGGGDSFVGSVCATLMAQQQAASFVATAGATIEAKEYTLPPAFAAFQALCPEL